MKIITKTPDTKVTFGDIKAGEVFLDTVSFDTSHLFIKVNKRQDPDCILTEGIEGEEGGAAVSLVDGAIYFYNDHELVDKVEAETIITKIGE